TIASAMGSGRRAGLASAAGVALGIGMWCLAMTLGLAALFQTLPLARTALTVLAIGLLLWFASRYLHTAWAGWRHGADRVNARAGDRKSTRLNSSHVKISYAVFCLTKKNN